MDKDAERDYQQAEERSHRADLEHTFVETAFSPEHIRATIETEKRLGAIDGRCAFLGVLPPED